MDKVLFLGFVGMLAVAPLKQKKKINVIYVI
jgi:hypothetical protein